MDRHELNRMFDGLTPDPQREREILKKLLQDDVRRKKPMKNWKQIVVGAVAAALLVTGATASAVPGLSQRLLSYLGISPENAQTADLLTPGAMAVDVVKEDNGAKLHVTQVLRDRTSIMVLVDFTAPEGTSLKMGDPDSEKVFIGSDGFYGGGEHYFMNEAGEKIDLGIYRNYIYQWEILEDGDPADNHLSAMFVIKLPQGDMLRGKAVSMRVPVGTLSYSVWDEETEMPRFVEVYSGDWSCDVPLPQKDIGWTQQVDRAVGELDGAKIRVKELYLSPVNLLVTLGREGGEALSGDAEFRWLGLLDVKDIVLKDKDGNVIPLGDSQSNGGLIGDVESTHMFRLPEITDPANFQGGSITLDVSCGTVTIPLDDLTPVEP